MHIAPRSNTSERLAAEFVTAQYPQFRLSQISFLLAIEARPGVNHSELAAELGTTLSAVARNVDVFGSQKGTQARQHNHGLVETKKESTDDRIKSLYLTDKGIKFLRTLRQVLYGN